MKKEIIEDAEEVQAGAEVGDVLVEEVKLTVDKGQAPVRIDKFIHTFLGNNVSRTKIQAAAEAGSVLVNGKPVKSNYKIRPLDVILLLLPKHEQNYDLVAENIPIDIVYEDDDVIVINKSPEIVVHPGLG